MHRECIVDEQVQEHLRREEPVVEHRPGAVPIATNREIVTISGTKRESTRLGMRMRTLHHPAKSPGDCSSMTANTSTALTTRFTSGGTPLE